MEQQKACTLVHMMEEPEACGGSSWTSAQPAVTCVFNTSVYQTTLYSHTCTCVCEYSQVYKCCMYRSLLLVGTWTLAIL